VFVGGLRAAVADDDVAVGGSLSALASQTSASGTSRAIERRCPMSALERITDSSRTSRDVCFVPNSEFVRFGVATLIHDVGASPQSHIGRSESEIAAPYSDPDFAAKADTASGIICCGSLCGALP
jgi:hypothetical protein